LGEEKCTSREAPPEKILATPRLTLVWNPRMVNAALGTPLCTALIARQELVQMHDMVTWNIAVVIKGVR